MTKKERCQDCACLVETKECEYFCDEYEKPCEDIEDCGEWKTDPSTVTSKYLEALPQYHFEREDFVNAFNKAFTAEQMEEILSKCICNEQSNSFAFLSDDDEFYILHKDSGTVINWYKHFGRTNTCNKPGFGSKDLDEFLSLIKIDMNW